MGILSGLSWSGRTHLFGCGLNQWSRPFCFPSFFSSLTVPPYSLLCFARRRQLLHQGTAGRRSHGVWTSARRAAQASHQVGVENDRQAPKTMPRVPEHARVYPYARMPELYKHPGISGRILGYRANMRVTGYPRTQKLCGCVPGRTRVLPGNR